MIQKENTRYYLRRIQLFKSLVFDTFYLFLSPKCERNWILVDLFLQFLIKFYKFIVNASSLISYPCIKIYQSSSCCITTKNYFSSKAQRSNSIINAFNSDARFSLLLDRKIFWLLKRALIAKVNSFFFSLSTSTGECFILIQGFRVTDF